MKALRYARIVEHNGTLVGEDLFNDKLSFGVPVGEQYKPGSIITFTVQNSTAQIDALHAEPDSALAAIWQALSEENIDPAFPEVVNSEVQSIVDDPQIDDRSLPELTHLPFVTIDNEDSKDLDQAMHIERGTAGYTLHYALADAAHYVRPGSELFAEALARGASFYVPGFAVPMLPRALSEGLVSLNEGVDRRALVFTIHFNQSGEVQQTTVQQARIRSAAKLSYHGVEQYYKASESSQLNNQPYTATLDALRELGQLRIELAQQRNVVEYDRTTVEISLTPDGRAFDLMDTERLQVESYNEQISLVCNAEGARLLDSVGLPAVVQAVYRVHDAPDTERLVKFSRLLKGLIRHLTLDPELWTWRWRDGKYGDKENLSDYLSRLRTLEVDKYLLSVVQRQALMLSTASRFTAEAGVHHSLKLDQYARFSSPMREIAGIYTHREYLQYASYTGNVETKPDDHSLQQRVITAANRSKEIQKRLNKAVLKKAIDQLFEAQLRRSLEDRKIWTGTVVALRRTRVYVQLDKPSIRVKLYLRELARINNADYKLDRSGAYMSDEQRVVFSLGQRLRLRVADYSNRTERWQLVPA